MTITDQIAGPFITAIACFSLVNSNLTTKRPVGSNNTFTICEKSSNKKVATMTISKAKTEIKKVFGIPNLEKNGKYSLQCELKSETSL